MKNRLLTTVAVIASLAAAPALAQPDQHGDHGGGGGSGAHEGGGAPHGGGAGGPHGGPGGATHGGPGGATHGGPGGATHGGAGPAAVGGPAHGAGGAGPSHTMTTGPAHTMGGVTTQDTHRGNDTRHGNGQGWNGDGHDRSHQGGNGAGQGPHQAQGFVRGSTSARGGHFSYQGRNFNRVHGSAFRYPRGYSYRRWGLGQRLPRLFLSPLYFFTDYAAFGFGPPPFGDQWVRYGPDLLLVDVNSGEVVYVIYGAFY